MDLGDSAQSRQRHAQGALNINAARLGAQKRRATGGAMSWLAGCSACTALIGVLVASFFLASVYGRSVLLLSPMQNPAADINSMDPFGGIGNQFACAVFVNLPAFIYLVLVVLVLIFAIIVWWNWWRGEDRGADMIRQAATILRILLVILLVVAVFNAIVHTVRRSRVLSVSSEGSNPGGSLFFDPCCRSGCTLLANWVEAVWGYAGVDWFVAAISLVSIIVLSVFYFRRRV
jgi:hypothetical protein